MRLLWVVFIVCSFKEAFGQRVAPGVPPQHYQQVPQQQYAQQQQQYQQVPQQQQYQQQVHQQQQQVHQQQQQVHQQQIHQQQYQQQQVPVQQQQQPQIPVQHQQQMNAPGHQGGHGHHGQPQPILSAANLEHEKEHLAEHLHAPIDTSKMTEQELQFHYFKMHDADNNNKLDGCELIKSLIHWHEQGSKEKNGVEEKVFKDEELVSLIDPILNVDDLNKDGYIDYPEFIKAQAKAAVQRQQEK